MEAQNTTPTATQTIRIVSNAVRIAYKLSGTNRRVFDRVMSRKRSRPVFGLIGTRFAGKSYTCQAIVLATAIINHETNIRNGNIAAVFNNQYDIKAFIKATASVVQTHFPSLKCDYSATKEYLTIGNVKIYCIDSSNTGNPLLNTEIFRGMKLSLVMIDAVRPDYRGEVIMIDRLIEAGRYTGMKILLNWCCPFQERNILHLFVKHWWPIEVIKLSYRGLKGILPKSYLKRFAMFPY